MGPWNGVVAKISSSRKSCKFSDPFFGWKKFPDRDKRARWRRKQLLPTFQLLTAILVPLRDDIRCNVRDRDDGDRGEKLVDIGGDGSILWRKNSSKVGTNESWKGKGRRSVEFFEGNATLIDRKVSMKMVMSPKVTGNLPPPPPPPFFSRPLWRVSTERIIESRSRESVCSLDNTIAAVISRRKCDSN